MGWTQDIEERGPYDQFHSGYRDEDESERYDQEMEDLSNYRSDSELGWQARLNLDAPLDGLDESDYTIDNETGKVRPKTTQELFMRDYGAYLGVLALFVLFR